MNRPLVSVIIPTYNHSHYLKKAVDSILSQSYQHFEIIIMDDGSTDNTKEVVSQYNNISYLYQENAGLSAARNNAIPYCKGDYILFLDADDWLYPEALRIQLSYLIQDEDLYFVSGSHMKIYEDDTKFYKYGSYDITDNNFLSILQYHYISHPASVLFRSKALQNYRFDENFRACQDYDLYLTIARNHKVLHHSQLVSAYRLHSSNMSSNYAYMLQEALEVMQKHKVNITTDAGISAYNEGKKMFINFYTKAIYWDKLRKHKIKATPEEKEVIKKYTPYLYLKYVGNHILKR